MSPLPSRLLAMLLAMALAGCAETVSQDELTSSTTLQREYDKTLSKTEQKAVISELQQAQEKAKGKQPAGDAGSAAETGKAD